MTKEKIKQYSLTVSIIYLISLIISLLPALVTFSFEYGIFGNVGFGAYIAIPTAFLISGAVGQYYVSKFSDFLVCMLVNLIGTILLFIPFLYSFIESVWGVLVLYWIVFLIGFFISLAVRQISNFINIHSSKKS